MGAVMVSGCRNTPLHPLGSLDDHAYVLEDAGIDTLIFDPVFAERAEQLQRATPRTSHVCSRMGRPTSAWTSWAWPARSSPEALIAPDVDPEDLSALAYTGGTTGRPKGVMNTYRGSALMAQIMASEWQWPDEVRHLVCTPLSHADRRCSFRSCWLADRWWCCRLRGRCSLGRRSRSIGLRRRCWCRR